MAYLTIENKYVVFPAETNYIFNTWNNVNFATFSSSGINISSAIDSSAFNHYAETNSFYLTAGETIYFKFWLTLNVGSHPTNSPYLALRRSAGTVADLTMSPSFNGYEYSFPAYVSDNYYMRIANQLKDVNFSSNFIFYTNRQLEMLIY